MQLPEDIEEYRDDRWRREATRQVDTAVAAERFIEQAGFVSCLTDSRRPGPSLYVAVCGRRDAVMPRNVQKDPEASLTWTLKDEIIGRGKVYYAKLARNKATFVALRMIPCFHAIWGMRRAEEQQRLSKPAHAILKVLRREWEMATIDLRVDYLRPGRGKYFIATARIVRQGKRIAVTHMELHNDEGKLIATGGAAYVIG